MVELNVFPRSILKVGAVAVLLLVAAFSSHASDSDRITLLEKEVQELKQRLQRLESPQADTGKQHKPVASSDGWKSLTSWRLLKKGMSYDDVRAILGEPGRVRGGNITFWYYANRGDVIFYEDRLESWTEPR